MYKHKVKRATPWIKRTSDNFNSNEVFLYRSSSEIAGGYYYNFTIFKFPCCPLWMGRKHMKQIGWIGQTKFPKQKFTYQFTNSIQNNFEYINSLVPLVVVGSEPIVAGPGPRASTKHPDPRPVKQSSRCLQGWKVFFNGLAATPPPPNRLRNGKERQNVFPVPQVINRFLGFKVFLT